MKIDINKLKEIPSGISSSFGLCQYGKELSPEIKEWADFHEFKYEQSGPCVNVYVDKDPAEIFLPYRTFKYMDGFSPNLDKHLHLGHLSNLVMAKAFQSLGVAKYTSSLLGDTLPDKGVSKEDALSAFQWMCDTFGFVVDEVHFASQVQMEDELEPGEGDYEGTKVFVVGDKKVVGVKSSGETSYFYHDVAYATMLNGSVLYVTGSEQNNHFAMLKEMFPKTHHVGLGLVTVKGSKMSSRIGNIITAKDALDFLYEEFGDWGVVYNVLAGFFIKSAPSTSKSIDFHYMSNPMNSQGLYLSYTLAKLKSAGLKCEPGEKFHAIELEYKAHKAKFNLSPNVLFDEVYKLAEKISGLYVTHKIVDNPDNQIMFGKMGSDLAKGMSMLGLSEVKRV